MLHAVEVFFVRILLLAGLCGLAWWGAHQLVGQHDQLTLGKTAGQAQASARASETSAATAQQQAVAVASSRGVRAGLAIGKASRVVPPAPASGEQPMIGNDTLRNIVGQGR